MKNRIIRTALAIIFGLLLAIPGTQAQQVWPGDVNNNGIVNNIDVLYWALAKDATGPARPAVSTDWEAQDISSEWSQSFPDGLNYVFADCNGDGTVNDTDLDVIRTNIWQVQAGGIITPDDYFLGNSGTDPTLLLEAEDPITEAGADEDLILSLGAEEDSIQNFVGIAFSIKFDPDEILDSPGSSNQNFSFQFSDDSWIDGQGTEMAQEFLFVDDENGVAEVALFRKSTAGPVTGAGPVGTFSIVIEEVIFLRAELQTDSIRVINPELESSPIAPSRAILAEDSLLLNTTQAFLPEGEVRAYPNPGAGRVTLEMKDARNQIQAVEVYDSRGKWLKTLRASRPGAQVEILLGQVPNGLYLLKIKTDKGILTKTIAKMPGR